MKTNAKILLDQMYNHCLLTFRHSIRVGDDFYNFASYLGLDNPERLFLMGALHDIGKIKIPASLLNKKGRLTPQEFDELKKHTLYGEQILKKITQLPSDFAEVALYHHENIDGTGYVGLKGTEIPYLSRIIRIIDTYDTMLIGRSYQRPTSQDHILKEIYSLSEKHYDKALVDEYAKYLGTRYPLNFQYAT